MEEIERVRVESLAYVQQAHFDNDEIQNAMAIIKVTEEINRIAMLDMTINATYMKTHYSDVFKSKDLKLSFPKNILVKVEDVVGAIDYIFHEIVDSGTPFVTIGEKHPLRIWRNTSSNIFLSIISCDLLDCKISYGVGLGHLERVIACEYPMSDVVMKKVASLLEQ